jgi:hypothetical protein
MVVAIVLVDIAQVQRRRGAGLARLDTAGSYLRQAAA